jgi:hypothetical protein
MQQTLIEFHGIQVKDDGLYEIDSGRIMVFIQRSDVTQVSLEYGSLAQRPFIQSVAGVILILIGILPLLWLVDWAMHGGVFFAKSLFVVLFAIAGGSMLKQAVTKGNYLLVQTPRGARKLVFSGDVDDAEAEAFVQEIRKRFGC